jgi:hypothetical protein
MSCRKPFDTFICGDLPVVVAASKVGCYPQLVQLTRHPRRIQERLDLRCKDKELIRPIIVKRLNAHVITCTEELLLFFVPDRKGEVADQVLGA